MEVSETRVTRDRCEAHRLAVGPDGQCVLCRRESDGASPTPDRASAAALPIPSRGKSFGWLLGATGAACLAMSFLGGVAMAKSHARPEAEQVAASPVVQPVQPAGALACEPAPQLAHLEEEPRVEAREVTPTTPAPPVVPRAEPQRNYLDEAYAAIDKRGLYDAAQTSSRGDATPTAKAGCVPRYYLARGPGAYGANTANTYGSYGNTSRMPNGTVGVSSRPGGGSAGGGGHFGAR